MHRFERRFLKLSLRDLFWLVLVCAMGLGWWIQARQLQVEATEQRRIAKHWRGQAFFTRDCIRLAGREVQFTDEYGVMIEDNRTEAEVWRDIQRTKYFGKE